MAENLTFLPLDVDEHREFLFAAHRETSRLTFGTTFTDEQIAREIEKERGRSTGVYLGDTIVGICDVETRAIPLHVGSFSEKSSGGGTETLPYGKNNEPPLGWVHFFYLTPEYRGLGFGAQLVEHAEKFCREQGLDKLCLRVGEPNTNARRFYERCGFVHAPELDKPGEHGFVKEIAL